MVPDYRGITQAEAAMGGVNRGPTEVAAGLAVQAPGLVFLDNVASLAPGPSGVGLAQSSAEEIADLQASGNLAAGNYDPYNSDDAVQIMQARISNVVGVCDERCTPQDRVILAALAQNRSIDKDTARTMMNNGFRWDDYFRTSQSGGQVNAQFRELLSSMDYKNLLLLLYVKDLKELHIRGWDLPYGITVDELDDLEQLATGK